MSRWVVPWWPPAVGTKLRCVGLGNENHAVLHVFAGLTDGVSVLVVTKEWQPNHQRWNYAIHTAADAFDGLIWLEGEPQPT